MQIHLTQADHELVSAAVAEAEAHTSGEIVTIVARRSDSYHDVGLSWAVAGTFIVLGLAAAVPGWLRDMLSALLLDWEHELPDWELLTGLLGLLLLTFLLIRYLLAIMPLRMVMTPRATRACGDAPSCCSALPPKPVRRGAPASSSTSRSTSIAPKSSPTGRSMKRSRPKPGAKPWPP
jgi:uncharacterized membrane protein